MKSYCIIIEIRSMSSSVVTSVSFQLLYPRIQFLVDCLVCFFKLGESFELLFE